MGWEGEGGRGGGGGGGEAERRFVTDGWMDGLDTVDRFEEHIS